VLHQDDAKDHREALAKVLIAEESVRIKVRILEAFGERGWDVGAAREKIQKGLPPGFTLDAKGVPAKR
jgi:hypothetical protein